MVRVALLLWGLNFAVSAGADTCGRFLAGEPGLPGLSLVAETYRSLLERLGGSLMPADLDTLEQGDPFLTFNEMPHVSAALQKHLRALTELVRRKGWDDPVTRQLVRQAIRELAERRRAATESIGKAILRPGPGIEVEFPERWQAVIHPTEELVLTYRRLTGRDEEQGPLTIFDEVKGTLTERPGSTEPVTGATFSRDGRELFVAIHFQVWRVPFRDGMPHWNEAIRIGDRIPDRANVQHRLVENPVEQRLYLGTTYSGKPTHFIDLKTNRRVALDLSLFDPDEIFPHQFGVVPGTRYLFVTAPGRQSYELRLLEIDDDGVAKYPAKDYVFPLQQAPVQVLTGGKAVLMQTSHFVEIVPLAGGAKRVYLELSGQPSFPDGKIRAAALDREEKTLAVLAHQADDTVYVEWFDVETGESKGRTSLRKYFGYRNLEYLPNGRLLVSGADSQAAVFIDPPDSK